MRIDHKPEKIKLADEQFAKMIGLAGSQEKLLAFYLYGSYGTKLQTPLSDIDLAVLPVPKTNFDWQDEAELACQLKLIGKSEDINLINLAKVPITLQMNVIKEGKLLFCRDRLLLADFVERVIKRYCDFAVDLETFYQDYDFGLQEEFLCR